MLINGPLTNAIIQRPLKALTSSVTLVAETEFKNGLVTLDGSGGAVEATLPSAASVAGFICTLICINIDNECSIATNVNGAPYSFSGLYDTITIFSDGFNIYKIGG
jgi:hypothetical protein